jgi:hypothetical protein
LLQAESEHGDTEEREEQTPASVKNEFKNIRSIRDGIRSDNEIFG